jgi:hypothetical protein
MGATQGASWNASLVREVAAAIALFTTSPDVVLLVLAYGYLVSPIIEWAATRDGRKPVPVADLEAWAARQQAAA